MSCTLQAYQNGADEGDQEQFLRALQSSLEIFVNRMKSNSQRGRSIANDSSVQSLFTVISNMHPQLMKYTQEQEDMRGKPKHCPTNKITTSKSDCKVLSHDAYTGRRFINSLELNHL